MSPNDRVWPVHRESGAVPRIRKACGLIAAEPGKRDLPIGKFRIVQKTLKLIVWNCLDFRIDEGAGFTDLGEQVCQLCAASKIVIVGTIFGVFERGVMAESFGNLLELALELQTSKECAAASERWPLNSAIFA